MGLSCKERNGTIYRHAMEDGTQRNEGNREVEVTADGLPSLFDEIGNLLLQHSIGCQHQDLSSRS